MLIDIRVRCVLFHHSFYILSFGNNILSVHDLSSTTKNHFAPFCHCFLMGFGVTLILFTGAESRFLFCSSAASLVAVSIATHISSALFNASLSMDSNFFCVFSQRNPETKRSLNVLSRAAPNAQCSDNLRSCAV